MTFSYDLSNGFNDVERVRFHTADTVSASAWLQDEEITALIAEKGGWQAAVIAGLRYIIMKLSQPDFKADWLQVSNAEARNGYAAMLDEKKAEFGLGGLVATVTHTYRADSAQTEEPDFTGGRPGGGQSDDSLWSKTAGIYG